MKTKNKGITKGEWEVKFEEFKTMHPYLRILSGDRVICECFRHSSESKIKSEANAQLIAEAGTIANQTGYTPKQLAEQKDELLKMLDKLIKMNPMHDGFHEARLEAIQVIKNATK